MSIDNLVEELAKIRGRLTEAEALASSYREDELKLSSQLREKLSGLGLDFVFTPLRHTEPVVLAEPVGTPMEESKSDGNKLVPLQKDTLGYKILCAVRSMERSSRGYLRHFYGASTSGTVSRLISRGYLTALENGDVGFKSLYGLPESDTPRVPSTKTRELICNYLVSKEIGAVFRTSDAYSKLPLDQSTVCRVFRYYESLGNLCRVNKTHWQLLSYPEK